MFNLGAFNYLYYIFIWELIVDNVWIKKKIIIKKSFWKILYNPNAANCGVDQGT